MRTAVYTLLAEDQIIAEPSGAASIVPVLSRQPDLKGKNIVCVISGGSLDVDLLRKIVRGLDESSDYDYKSELLLFTEGPATHLDENRPNIYNFSRLVR